ncbi:nucleoside monophosphate kinase [Micromonospora sp. NBC_01796]|uniref:nucleoside monophosphate kinase n=1 Tax=Micromonospora sp. NBC_01796 TaxID=2975987 RepID=UPI002DD9C9EE|nr:nucleoside monophosphate kinase [Micromonospora sp. NBC_01796]WSA86678.1 nucleoside monophosphate kinase [Micromonospora sp. NBC_01796]
MRRKIAVLPEPGVIDAWAAAMLCSEALALRAYNVGDLCRAAVQNRTAWGERFARHMLAGELVPDEVMAEFVADTLARSPGRWTLFGYPRTIRQAELLTEHGHAPDTVIQLILDEDRIDQDRRLAARREQLPQILAEYRQRTAPVSALYLASDALHVLQKSASIEDLAADMQTIVVGTEK